MLLASLRPSLPRAVARGAGRGLVAIGGAFDTSGNVLHTRHRGEHRVTALCKKGHGMAQMAEKGKKSAGSRDRTYDLPVSARRAKSFI